VLLKNMLLKFWKKSCRIRLYIVRCWCWLILISILYRKWIIK